MCTSSTDKKNKVQGLARLYCDWTDCDKKGCDWSKPYQFYIHIGQHFDNRPVCDWSGCGKKGLPSKLKEHARSHTKEKMIGCPNCGVLFVNRIKFMDHCLRKQKITEDHLPCEVCQKVYPTERLLKNHMRIHINTVKCTLCEMSCSSPSNLRTHMKYKHQTDRQFKCEICNHRTKTQADLKDHQSRHTDMLIFCNEEGCSFSFKSKTGFETHYDKIHGSNDCRYACHICSSKYKRGSQLTKHLKSAHALSSSLSRFIYKKNFSTGYFTLQTSRYESFQIHPDQVKDREGSEENDSPNNFKNVVKK